MADPSETLGQVYRSSDGAVRPIHTGRAEAASYYADYVEFVAGVSPAPGKLLDIGCGGGWSTQLFAQCGYDAVGIDLAPRFEVRADPAPGFAHANAAYLPFRDGSFDLVATYQTLEHTTEPGRVMTEALRVLRPGGIVCVVGPNLLSLGASVKALFNWVWRNRPVRRILLRDADMPRHPFGNTLPEAIFTLGGNLVRITRRSISATPVLEMRTPDLRPPFHGDNDACFVCNPLDLAKFFAANGCRILVNGKPGRPRATRMLATGTFLAAQKPK